MKTLGAGLVMAGLLLSSCSNEISTNEVPSVVVSSFKSQFTDATDIEWEQAGNNFEVEFTLVNEEYEALIDSSGNLIMSKVEITMDDLPASVSDAIASGYADEEISEVEKIERDGQTYFQVEFANMLKEKNVVFTESGEVENSFTF